MKTEKGLKAVFAILGEEETSNQSFASALSTVALPPTPPSTVPTPPATAASVTMNNAFPATSLKLRSILKKRRNETTELHVLRGVTMWTMQLQLLP